jgi:nucleoside-diphosphate-sugar epimerase
MASTSEVYGDPTQHPQTEDYWGNVNPTGIRSCYDESKRFAEALTMSYRRQHRLDVRMARIFNTYGPRCDPNDGRLVPNFITQALTNQPITVFGDGSQTRSLCYVADLIDGLWLAMTHEHTSGEVFNIGNPEEHTVLEYAQLVRGLCDSSSEIVFQVLPADDPQRRRPDISKARTVLGWEPRVGLVDGLQQTIEWYRAGLEQPAWHGTATTLER